MYFLRFNTIGMLLLKLVWRKSLFDLNKFRDEWPIIKIDSVDRNVLKKVYRVVVYSNTKWYDMYIDVFIYQNIKFNVTFMEERDQLPKENVLSIFYIQIYIQAKHFYFVYGWYTFHKFHRKHLYTNKKTTFTSR